MKVKTIVIATGNHGKLVEFRQLLPPTFQLLSASQVGVVLPEETGTTLAENSLLKAKSVFNQLSPKHWVIADDSGLEVDSLNGEPGVYSARYAGVNASMDENIALLLAKLTAVANRSARFKAVLSLVNEAETMQFEGSIDGKITTQPLGKNGFGYDPIFIPNGYRQTFGELTADVKNKLSHRALAVQKLVTYLEQQA